jgi:hypothetical protein
MTKVPFPRPLTEKTAKQAKHAILRGALLRMRRINPSNGETYDTRLLYLKTEDSIAYRLFTLLADALNGAASVPPQHAAEPKVRQRARDWLDALDAYLDRKYPCQAQTEPSAPAGAKGTNGAPTPPSAADAAASGCASAEDPGLAPDDHCGKGLGSDASHLLTATLFLDNIRTRKKSHLHAAMEEVLDELEEHREALKRAGLLKP